MKKKHEFKIILLILANLLLLLNLSGQEIVHNKFQYYISERLSKTVSAEFLSEVMEIPIKNADPFIAIGFNADLTNDHAHPQFQLRVSKDLVKWTYWQTVGHDHENSLNPLRINTVLSFFEKDVKFFQIKITSTKHLSKLNFSFISPGATPEKVIATNLQKSKLSKTTLVYDRPEYVNRKGWLCPQDENVSSRSLTTVTHLIIHHSAGNTVSNDYAAVVRSYWDYHVNGHGWDDIGYNWLVDPNGVLYKGRAWKSETEENVLGAHNSAQNSGTSGICFIGNYEGSTIPSEEGLNMIARLSAFLCDSYDINPVGTSYHAAIGRVNDNITGHGQSGGGTACPGTQIINRMPDIRLSTQSKLVDVDAAPIVHFTYPNAEVDSAYLTKDILIEFSHPMDKQSVESSFTLTPAAFGSIGWNDEGSKLYFTPSSPLPSKTYFQVVISTDAKSKWGINLENELSISFVTKQYDRLSLKSAFPENQQTDIDLNVNIELVFDAPISTNTLGGNIRFVDLYENDVPIIVDMLAFEEGRIFFIPRDSLKENSTYQILLKEGLGSTENYFLGDSMRISFTTKAITGVENFTSTPNEYELIECYPNPFNPSTTIKFYLEEASLVSLKIYDLLGNEVANLIGNKQMLAGSHTHQFNANNLSTGIYFANITTFNKNKTIKLLLTK